MKRPLTLIRQDLVLTWRNGLVFFTGVLLLIMLSLIWLLPESMSTEATEVIYDGSGDGHFEAYLRQMGAGDELFVGSGEELQAVLDDTSRGIGVIYEGDLQDPRFRLLTVGRLAEENLNLMEALLDTAVRTMRGERAPGDFDVTLLREPSDPVPLNLSIVPIALVFEVVLLGFTVGAVMIFQEKQEGANRAYRVSPGTTLDYIMAKNVMFTMMSVIYGGLLLFAAFRLDADYGPIMLLIILSSSMMTLIGLAIAVFFNNISEWFFVGIGVLIVNMLPIFSYTMPTFAPSWLTLIPSYPVLFGARELLFPTGKSEFLAPLLVQLLILNVIAFGLSYLAVDRKLMRAG
ncbi:MAG TPA: ABC transporter permease [Candidatus Sulfomarinibacteraceae bacterium]|nr:ABC transporter permease [Candidatus Sulfomarinibacteraceae bacterium]